MRISDWSSDVCSSDLYVIGIDATEWGSFAGDHAVGQTGQDDIGTPLFIVQMAASIRRRDTLPLVDVLSHCPRRDLPAEDVANADHTPTGEVSNYKPTEIARTPSGDRRGQSGTLPRAAR